MYSLFWVYNKYIVIKKPVLNILEAPFYFQFMEALNYCIQFGIIFPHSQPFN